MKKSNIKKRVILLYNNIDHPFINLFCYENDSFISKQRIDLPDYQINDGMIVNQESLVQQIKELCPNINELYILLSINESFKSVTSLPKMNKGKAKSLYIKDLKESFPDYKKSYEIFSVTYHHSLGSIFYTYFLPENIVDGFKKIGALLGTRIKGFDLYSRYIFDRCSDKEIKDAVYFVEDDNLGTLVLMYNHTFITGVSFKCTSEEDINKYFMLYIAKHEFELEKKALERIVVLGDSSYFEKLGYDLEIIHQENNLFNTFKFNGIKL